MSQVRVKTACLISPVLLLLILIALPRHVAGQLDFALAEGEIADAPEATPWTGSIAAGLNAKTGNSDNLDMTLSVNLTKETDAATTNLLANYFYSANADTTTTDRFFGQGRRERKLSNPRLSWFNQAGFETDRFKDFDLRIALHTGLSYKAFEFEGGFLKLRLGTGASREVGSANNDWSPELQLGSDWEKKITETTRLYASLDYYPNISDFGDFRLNTNTGVDFLLDATRNINFRIFAIDRYDSTPPPGNNSNDLEYGLALVVGF